MPEARRALPGVLLLAVLLVAVAAQLAHGLPRPNPWASTHLLFDWTLGPVRRGLVGEALRRGLGDRLTQRQLDVTAIAVLAGWAALLAALWRRAAPRLPSDALDVLVATFVASVALRTLLVDVGYLDHAGLLVALACPLLPHRLAGDVARLGLVVVGVLVHEAFAVAFLPLVLLDMVLADTGQGGRGAGPAVALGLAALAVTGAVATGLRLPEDALPGFLAHVRGRSVDVVVEAPAVDVLARGTDESLRRMRVLWSEPARWGTLARNGGWTLMLAAVYAGLAVAYVEGGRGRGLRCAAVVLAVVAPLALHAVAWDLCRFDALATVAGFVALALVLGRPGPPIPVSAGALGAGVLVALAEAAVVVTDAVPVAP